MLSCHYGLFVFTANKRSDYETIHADFPVAFCDICPTVVRWARKSVKHANINVHKNMREMGVKEIKGKKFFQKRWDKAKIWPQP